MLATLGCVGFFSLCMTNLHPANEKKLKPEEVVHKLKGQGMAVGIEEAATILQFFRKIAHIQVSQYLDKHRHDHITLDATP
jgi:hypothetical protein